MKLTKLQGLVESNKVQESSVRRFFDALESAMDSVVNQVEGKTLSSILERNGFPATESKALRDAVDKAYTEFEELKKALLMPYQD